MAINKNNDRASSSPAAVSSPRSPQHPNMNNKLMTSKRTITKTTTIYLHRHPQPNGSGRARMGDPSANTPSTNSIRSDEDACSPRGKQVKGLVCHPSRKTTGNNGVGGSSGNTNTGRVRCPPVVNFPPPQYHHQQNQPHSALSPSAAGVRRGTTTPPPQSFHKSNCSQDIYVHNNTQQQQQQHPSPARRPKPRTGSSSSTACGDSRGSTANSIRNGIPRPPKPRVGSASSTTSAGAGGRPRPPQPRIDSSSSTGSNSQYHPSNPNSMNNSQQQQQQYPLPSGRPKPRVGSSSSTSPGDSRRSNKIVYNNKPPTQPRAASMIQNKSSHSNPKDETKHSNRRMANAPIRSGNTGSADITWSGADSASTTAGAGSNTNSDDNGNNSGIGSFFRKQIMKELPQLRNWPGSCQKGAINTYMTDDEDDDDDDGVQTGGEATSLIDRAATNDTAADNSRTSSKLSGRFMNRMWNRKGIDNTNTNRSVYCIEKNQQRSTTISGATNHSCSSLEDKDSDRNNSDSNSENGDDFHDDNSSIHSVYYEDLEEEKERDIKNPVWKCIIGCLIMFKCIPKDLMDSTPLKNALRSMQWCALIFDLAASIVAIITFSGNTMCCGSPVLNVIGNAPWDDIVPIAAYVYAIFICFEIYPVMTYGIPFNIINPVLGCALTIAMFFDDSEAMALSMWCLEASAVLCEIIIYILKAMQQRAREDEILRVGLLTKSQRPPHMSVPEHQKYLKKMRKHYYQLRVEQQGDEKTLWYLAFANVINGLLVAIILILILFTSKAGGLCIDMDINVLPNPFTNDQLARCAGCPHMDPSQICEVCTAEHNKCYYPYS